MTFTKSKTASRFAKVLLIGDAGSGKTHAALTFPKPAVIDAEGSIDWFADRFDFVSVPTKSYKDVTALVQSVRNGQVKCDTLVIDSLTSIYNGLLNAASSEREDLRPLDWGRIKRKFSQLLDELYHQLPTHVVCVGWIKPEYAKPGDNVNGKVVGANDLVKLGETFDGDRKAMYAFDFVFRMEAKGGKHFATVVKSRSGKLTEGQRIENFSFATIKALLPKGDAPAPRGMTDEEQIERDQDAPPGDPQALPPVVAALCDRWRAATGGDEAAFRAKYTGQKVADIRASVEAAEAEKARATAQETPARANREPKADSSAAQHRLSKALFAELGVTDDADRHAYYEQVCGYDAAGEPIDTWAKVVGAGQASLVIDSLLADIAERAELDAALPT